MARVTGIGGFFYRAEDPAAMSAWYEEHLGVRGPRPTYEEGSWWQDTGPTVVAPFRPGEGHFDTGWMLNLRVDDLDGVVERLRDAGIDVMVDPADYPNGRFAALKDPEGNPIELWQPDGTDLARPTA